MNKIRNLILHHVGDIFPFLTMIMLILELNACSPSFISDATTNIKNLRVQSIVEPTSIEDNQPLFSWVMESKVTGQKQTAYQIVVERSSDNHEVWNTGIVKSEQANNIRYAGMPLQPEMSYSFQVTVWDKDEKFYVSNSRFETGIMNPGLAAWEGAQFIGTNALTLDATSALLFEIRTDFQIIHGDAASVVFGANDFRYNNKFQNINNVEGENYVRVELDVSGVGTEKGAALKIYRVGYEKDDNPHEPYEVISVEKYPETNINDIINQTNKKDQHNLSISVNASNITFEIDGVIVRTTAPSRDEGNTFFTGAPPPSRGRGANVSITNNGSGNNYTTYPNLNSVGFAANPGEEVLFSNYKIKNLGRSNPDNDVVFDAKTGAGYAIFEGLEGVNISDAGKLITVTNTKKETKVGYADPSSGSLSMLRTTFASALGKSIEKAKLFVTSMGSNVVYINGQRVGDEWFGPGDSQFRETLCYLTYDVTGLMQNGDNVIGAILNPGWYTGYMTYTPGNFNFFGDTEALLAKLVIEYQDGSKSTVVTDPAEWKIYKDGPIEYGSFFQGERYNANKEANIDGWSTVAYNDRALEFRQKLVKPREWINFDIVARKDQAVRIVETLKAKSISGTNSDDSHTYTYDMGVNMVGVPSITIPAGWLTKDDVIILRYGEQVYPGLEGDGQEYIDLYGYKGHGKAIAGRILSETYRAALSTDFYIAKGSEKTVIQPTTTYRGYQYIQITLPSHTGPLPLENVKGLVLSSDQLPTGTYLAKTADGTTGELANQLFRNIQRSQLGNFFTIPTDCPQRNERMGWTGDAQAYTRTATYNSDVRNFFRQWMVALRNDQGIGGDGDVAGGIGSTVPTLQYAR